MNGNMVFGTMSIRRLFEAMGEENIPQTVCKEEVKRTRKVFIKHSFLGVSGQWDRPGSKRYCQFMPA